MIYTVIEKNKFLLFFIKRQKIYNKLIDISRANRQFSVRTEIRIHKHSVQFITQNQIFQFARNKNTQSMKVSSNDNANFLTLASGQWAFSYFLRAHSI